MSETCEVWTCSQCGRVTPFSDNRDEGYSAIEECKCESCGYQLTYDDLADQGLYP